MGTLRFYLVNGFTKSVTLSFGKSEESSIGLSKRRSNRERRRCCASRKNPCFRIVLPVGIGIVSESFYRLLRPLGVVSSWARLPFAEMCVAWSTWWGRLPSCVSPDIVFCSMIGAPTSSPALLQHPVSILLQLWLYGSCSTFVQTSPIISTGKQTDVSHADCGPLTVEHSTKHPRPLRR
jgi:hypothetical protein